MGRIDNIRPGEYKFTDEDREKSHESKRINSAIKKSALKYRGLPVTDPKDIAFMELYSIPKNEQTLGNLSVLRAWVDASKGDKDARRDAIRMSGDDPEEKRKEEELKLKKSQLDQAKEAPEDTAASAWSEVLGQIRGVMENDESESAG